MYVCVHQPWDDLAVDIELDEKTTRVIRQLNAAKKQAIDGMCFESIAAAAMTRVVMSSRGSWVNVVQMRTTMRPRG